LHLVAGDAIPTLSQLAVRSSDGALGVHANAPGDGTVLRTSALLDERVGGRRRAYDSVAERFVEDEEAVSGRRCGWRQLLLEALPVELEVSPDDLGVLGAQDGADLRPRHPVATQRACGSDPRGGRAHRVYLLLRVFTHRDETTRPRVTPAEAGRGVTTKPAVSSPETMDPRAAREARVSDPYEEFRPLMFSIAYRMLASASEAEDIVQEAFLRFHRESTSGTAIQSPKAYLSTITTRLAIDQLRSARVRRGRYVGTWLPEPLVTDTESDAARHAEAGKAEHRSCDRIPPHARVSCHPASSPTVKLKCVSSISSVTYGGNGWSCPTDNTARLPASS